MLAENLEIFKETRNLLGEILGYNNNVNREVKYAEWSDLRKKANDALDTIYLINSENNPAQSMEHLRYYLFLLYGVKNRIRLLAETKYLPVSYKTKVIVLIDSCSQQAVNWRKFFERKSQNQGAMAN